jgi:hypothetical protein
VNDVRCIQPAVAAGVEAAARSCGDPSRGATSQLAIDAALAVNQATRLGPRRPRWERGRVPCSPLILRFCERDFGPSARPRNAIDGVNARSPAAWGAPSL